MDVVMNVIARPFGQILMFLYEATGSYALSLVLIALIVKVIMLPFQMKSKRGMMRQSRLQPKVAELQKKHGANKAKLNEEMSKMYKEEGINPASGCLWGFLPMPIMFALFFVILINNKVNNPLYSGISKLFESFRIINKRRAFV